MKARAAAGGLILGGAMLAVLATTAAADTGILQVQRDAGIERIRLTLPQQTAVRSALDGARLTLKFERPVDLEIQALNGLSHLAAAPRLSPDRLELELILQPGVTALNYADERVLFVDLLPPGRSGRAAEKARPAEPGKAANRVAVRTGEHRDFSRLVFDWPRPTGYQIERSGDTATLRFDKAADLDAKRLTARKLALVKAIEVGETAEGATVRLNVEPGAVIRDFRLGQRVVVDVLKAGSRDKSVTVAHRLTAPPAPAEAVPPEAPQPAAAAAAPPARSEPPPAAAMASAADAATPQPPPAMPAVATSPVLRFDWPRAVGAAVFRRGETLWCVFDTASSPDIARLAAAAGGAVSGLALVPHPDATVLRMTTASEPRLARDGHAWLLSFDGEAGAADPVVPQPELGVDTGPQLVLPVLQPSRPIPLTDPDTDENLVVVPLAALGRGLSRGYRYPTFRLLASAQGIVIQPLIDALEVRASADGVLLSSPQALGISPLSVAQRVGAKLAPPPEVGRALAFRGWVDAPATSFVAHRQALLRTVSESSGPARRRSQLELAHFYLAHGLAAEALADATMLDRKGMSGEERAAAQAIIGVSNLMLGRTEAARKALADPSLARIDEAGLWSTAAAAAMGDVPAGERLDLAKWSSLLLAYPRPLRQVAQPLLIDAALSRHQNEGAELLLVAARNDAPTPDESAWLDYLDGKLKLARADKDGARAAMGRAAAAPSRRANAYAGTALVDLDLAEGKLTHREATERLEALKYTWRGDDFEIDLLMRLAQMYAERHDYPPALRALRQVASSFRGHPRADAAAQRLSEVFETVFLRGDFEPAAPMAEVALYNEFKELTPPGEKGRRIVLGLAQRLLALDLAEPVIALLEPTLRTPPADAGRAELGMTLAEAYARAGNWEAVLATLNRTAGEEASGPLSDGRALLAARALAHTGRRDEALARLATVGTKDAMRLRAALLRRGGEWKAAADTSDALLGSAAAKTPAEIAETVIDLSVARTLAGETAAVGDIGRTQAPAVAGTAGEAAFRLLTGNGPGAVPDRDSLRRSVDEAVRFRDALKAPAPRTGNATP